jgi:hypothetical protein
MDKDKTKTTNNVPEKDIPSNPVIYNKVSGARHLDLDAELRQAFVESAISHHHWVIQLIDDAKQKLVQLTAIIERPWGVYDCRNIELPCKSTLQQLANALGSTLPAELTTQLKKLIEGYKDLLEMHDYIINPSK